VTISPRRTNFNSWVVMERFLSREGKSGVGLRAYALAYGINFL
jgi:hypothetical protein